MQEPSNDRLEQFFRKAAARADVTFNEDDWKKLEARLEAGELGKTAGRSSRMKVAGTIITAGVLLMSIGLWMNARYNVFSSGDVKAPMEKSAEGATAELPIAVPALADESEDKEGAATNQRPGIGLEQAASEGPGTTTLEHNAGVAGDHHPHDRIVPASNSASYLPLSLDNEKIDRELVRGSALIAERYKQKAVVELPGAEEGETREAEAMVEEEHASDQTKHVATPRLSLLLSFAPDFSGTSLGQYSAPGKAYGAMIHYHLFNRWSISSGIIRNQKQYTGDGESYKPPKGYWKYYTNGIIPETIDGSCSILEFPLMVQYTLQHRGKNKWTVGTGVSSYLMQSESYVYNFDQPNPGAKERWDSRKSSRFMFNMINFTIGYERQVLPGLMLGVEPYAKIPLEEIGWSNLRLFSTGASITLRYTVIRSNKLSLPEKSRAPD